MPNAEIKCDPGRIPDKCQNELCEGLIDGGKPRYNLENWGTHEDQNPLVVLREYVCEDFRCLIALSYHEKYHLPERIYDIKGCGNDDQRCGIERPDLLEFVKEIWTARKTIERLNQHSQKIN